MKKHFESVHEGIKPFKCHICPFESAQKANLQTHMQTVHEGVKPFQCEICDFKTAVICNLKKHIESVHEVHLSEIFVNAQKIGV